MNFDVKIDWKFIAALGAAVMGTILVLKMNSDAAERVSIHAIDTGREYAIAGNGNR